jgi:hypothetical protein
MLYIRFVFAVLLLFASIVEGANQKESIIIATVSCRQQVDTALRRLIFSYSQLPTPIKSTKWYVLYHDSFLQNAGSNPYILLCKNVGPGCEKLLNSLKESHNIHIIFQSIRRNVSLHLFKPCATSRLWLDELLPAEKAVLYLDTDTMVVSDLRPLWHTLNDFPKSVFMGLVAENFRGPEFPLALNLSSRTPVMTPPYGINTGVMLIDLEKQRKSQFTKTIKSILNSGSVLPLGDQCIVNMYATQHPRHYMLLSCIWNSRGHPHSTTDHCLDQDLNKLSGILHGNRGHFTSPRTWLDSHVLNETIRGYFKPMNKLYIHNAKMMQENVIWAEA